MDQLTTVLKRLQDAPDFALFVDPEQIRVFRWDGHTLTPPICTLRTLDILGEYDPELHKRRVFEPYLCDARRGLAARFGVPLEIRAGARHPGTF